MSCVALFLISTIFFNTISISYIDGFKQKNRNAGYLYLQGYTTVAKSEAVSIEIGVPHGSALGPLLFTIYKK